MSLLLDSHAAYWWLGGMPEMSKRARQAINDAGPGTVFFSAVSCYELGLKMTANKMTPLPGAFIELARGQGFIELPISARHADLAARLPSPHKDPWDRVLAAQAICESMAIVTRDPRIAALGATVLW
jgi:PIN domain nuclease of toxin-antitoxin system